MGLRGCLIRLFRKPGEGKKPGRGVEGAKEEPLGSSHGAGHLGGEGQATVPPVRRGQSQSLCPAEEEGLRGEAKPRTSLEEAHLDMRASGGVQRGPAFRDGA